MPIHSSLHLSNTTTTTTTQGSGNGANLQRNGTRTGDIPIGIEQGYGNGYESESQDSHSVAHAYVNTAQHVAISPAQAQQNVFQQHHQSITSQPPQRPGQHVHKTSNGSSNLGLPNSTTTGTSSKRAVTPDRAYNPAGSMAVAGRSSGKDTGVPAWVGRTSEEKTWGLDGAHGADKMRSAANATSALGRPIMDDRTRLAATAPGGNAGQPTRRVSRVPPPKA
ncbi:hypothetical protein M408DRAFT_29471 [Serendipita vermifera MAFF 305830]|uniref:Uncharacterized protein n=1 Tax=Serendipita vermifera MAFF 305830 TaxID=933852 RepID=A0A0C3AQN8_SERVB|nr:hypothetical protein M408DRAFT_29471 [Serendipita vermifera MAFF 305830]